MGITSKVASFWAFVNGSCNCRHRISSPRRSGRRAGMFLAIVALNLGSVYMAVLFNDWYKLFYDALQNKDQAVFWTQMGRFTYLAFIAIVIAVYRFYLTQLLEMNWRQWMTGYYLRRWLGGNAFYQMELARFVQQNGTAPDNPDQRISEDVNQFTSQTIGLTMGVLNASVTLASFVGILWTLSGAFDFRLGGQAYVIPASWSGWPCCIAWSAAC